MTVTRRTRLAVAGVAAASVIVTVSILYAVWVQATVTARTDELARQIGAIARGMSAGAEVDLGATEPLSDLRAQIFEVEAGLMNARLVLTDAQGSVVHASPPGEATQTYEIDDLTGPPDDEGVRTGVRSLPRSGRVIIAAAPVTAAPDDGYLLAVQPVRELAAVRRTGAIAGLIVGFIAIVVAWLTGSIVAHRVTAPLVRLREGAEAIERGAWGHQVLVEGDEEVRALAASFNAMSARVDAAYTAQKDFVGDVSHELRTPITSIQGYAGALVDGMADTDEKRERFATVIRQESERLMELTGALLDLADLDSGRVEMAHVAIDVDVLAGALRSRHEEPARQAGIALDVGDLGEGSRPLGDEHRVLQVASALVTNAIAHTPHGGTVRVRALADGASWTLLVEDSGPGIPLEERERVFQRFTRLDPSRTAATGGFGLGLAICRRIVEGMGGEIAVGESSLGGACFSVTLDTGQAVSAS